MKSKVLSEMMGVPLSTVYRYVAQLKKDGKLEPLPPNLHPFNLHTPQKSLAGLHNQANF